MSDGTETKPLVVTVDRARCCGYGICAEICSDVFKLDESGMAYADSAHVPPHLEAAALEALDSCPEEAIYSSREDDGPALG